MTAVTELCCCCDAIGARTAKGADRMQMNGRPKRDRMQMSGSLTGLNLVSSRCVCVCVCVCECVAESLTRSQWVHLCGALVRRFLLVETWPLVALFWTAPNDALMTRYQTNKRNTPPLTRTRNGSHRVGFSMAPISTRRPATT